MLREFNGLNFKVTKAFQRELDSVEHPSDDYSSLDAHHQPHFSQAEDLEHSIREMFKEFKQVFYKPEMHEYDPLDKDSSLYNMNTYHDFEGCIKYDTFMFKLLTYYSSIHRIFKLEYFIAKSAAKPLDVLHLERYVYNGSDYWRMTEAADIEVPEDNTQFEIYSDSDDSRAAENVVSKSIIKQIVTQKRRRLKLQDDLENLYEAMTRLTKNLDSLQEKTLDSLLEFTSLYHENRFHNVVYSVDKCLDKLYNSSVTEGVDEHSIIKQITSLQCLKKKLANRDKRYVPWFNYRFYCNFSEYYQNTKPSINEEATSPEQISILQEMYPQIKFSKNVFSGQKIEHPYSCLDVEILDLTKEMRAYIQTASNSMKGFTEDYLNVFKLSNKKDVANLRDQNDLIKTFVSRTQLKFALFTWYTREDHPVTPYQYRILSLKFRDNLFKKIYNQKNTYLKSIQSVVGSTKLDIPSDDLIGIMTPIEQEKLKLKRTQAMSKYTLLDQVSQAKSETIVVRDELDRNLLIHAIDIIEMEYGGLSSALDRETSHVSAFIHPFQQFTSVCFPTVDKHSHLDMINKVVAVQKCLTRLKNRCTEVETLTSGPGIVFTIKDFNE